MHKLSAQLKNKIRRKSKMTVTAILIATIVVMSAAKAYLLWRWSFSDNNKQEKKTMKED